MRENLRLFVSQIHGFLVGETTARLFFWLALFSPTLLALWRSGGAGRSWQSLLWAAAACAIPAALPRRLFFLAQATALVTLPVLLWWIGYASLNGVGPGWEAAAATMLSSSREALEAGRLVSGMPGFLACSCACALFLAASAAAMLSQRKNPVLRDLSPGFLKAILAAALMPFAVSAVSATARAPVPLLFQLSDASFSPLGTAARLAMEGIDRALYGDLLGTMDERRPGHAPFLAKEASLAIFVIGESVRADSIGPQKTGRGPWTQALDKRVKAGLGAWLPTTCAGSHGTHLSVPMLLTGTPPERHVEATIAPSVLAMLKAAGFATAWISNQHTAAFKENGHDLYWSASRAASIAGGYDGNMVPVVDAFTAPLTRRDSGSAAPRAVALHMIGSHFEYVDRYPPSMFTAEPDGLAPDALTELRYERSVEYTAKVLGELAQLLDRSAVPAFLIFTGDHGENLPGDHNGLGTHLGPRASIRDGTTTTLVLWNKAMAATNRPKAIAPLLGTDLISHADVARAFIALSGMAEELVVPDPEPRILAPVVLHGPVEPNACSRLQP